MKAGLSPLHIVAITGHLEILKKLHAYYMCTGLLEEASRGLNIYHRTFLELAAAHGSSQIVDFYRSTHKFTIEQ